jgi:hypothetical protein
MVIVWGLGIALLIIFRCVSIDDAARPRTDAGTVLTAALLVLRGQPESRPCLPVFGRNLLFRRPGTSDRFTRERRAK